MFRLITTILISFTVFCIFFGGNAIAVSLTIEDALARAFKYNRTYIGAVEELGKGSARVAEARAGAFPVISGFGEYSRNWEPSEFVISMGGVPQRLKIGTDNTFRAGFSVTQPIFLGGKVSTALKIAKLYRKYARADLVRVYNQVRLEVFHAYYGYLEALDMVRVSEQANDQARASRIDMEKMFSQGVVSEYDLLRARVAEANTLPTLIKARSAAKTAGDALKSTLGMDLSEEIDLLTQYDFTGIDTLLNESIDYYNGIAFSKRSDLTAMKLRVDMLDKNISIEKAAYYPSLFFSTNLMWEAQRDDWDLDADNWTRSLNSSFSLTVPIFEGFGRSAKVKQARVDKQQAELQYKQFIDGIELEVSSAFGNLKEAYERLNSQKQTVEMAREGLRISELRFQNGVGTQLEIIDARFSLTVAETNLAEARHDLIVSLAEFEKAIGVIEPDEELFK